MKLLILVFLVFSSNLVYAYDLSDLNGTWSVESYNATGTMQGLPKGKVKLHTEYVAGYRATANGRAYVGYCNIQKLGENSFESTCYYSGYTDHTVMRFISKDILEEDDLLHGLGTIRSRRIR